MNDIPDDEPQNALPEPPARKRSSRAATATVLLLLGLHALGFKIMYIPLNRVIENRFCRSYYLEHDPSVVPSDGLVPEKLCKVNEVQQQLAALFGTVESFHLFIDLAVAIPFSMLSDRGFRRTVAALNFVGLASMYAWIFGLGYFTSDLNSKFMLLGPILSIVGGGECVFMSTVSALVTDVATTPIERTTIFAYVSSVTYFTHAICPSLAGITMSIRLWLPFAIGLSLLSVGVLASALLPPSHDSRERRTSENDPLLRRAQSSDAAGKPEHPSSTVFNGARAKLRALGRQVSGRRNFQLLIGIFFVASFASSNSALLPQYISKRYSWTFAHSGYLLSIKALVNITLLAIVVPTVVHIMATRFDFEPGHISKLGAQLMFLISVIGVVLVALAPTVPYLIFAFFVYALGSAIPAFTLSLVAHPSVAGENSKANAMDYSVIMIGKFAGNMCGLPTMTVLWTKGIGLGGFLLGLPYFTSGVVYALGFLLVTAIHLRI